MSSIRSAEEARQITKAAQQIKRENDIQNLTDMCLRLVEKAAELGESSATAVKIPEEYILDTLDHLQNMGFNVSATDMTTIQIEW